MLYAEAQGVAPSAEDPVDTPGWKADSFSLGHPGQTSYP